MIIAAILTWPAHLDYPWFRQHMIRRHTYFKKVIICFTNLNQKVQFGQNIIDKLSYATFTKPLGQRLDWRDDAVNSSLSLDMPGITHYLFLEPDFLVNGDLLWKMVFNKDRDFVYYEEGGRIHPAFALIRRELADKTSLDFAAAPPAYDHFGKFFQEIREQVKGEELREIGLQEKVHFYHLGGLSQNYACYMNDQPFYKPNDFLFYNSKCMLIGDQIQRFWQFSSGIADKYQFTEIHPFLNDFFPEE